MINARWPVQRIDQVCVVVPDLRRAMAEYWSVLGIGPWSVYTYGAPLVKEMTYLGKPADFRIYLALAQVGTNVFELLQVLQGPTVYDDMQAHGGGIHHFGIFVPNFDQAIAEGQAAGFEVLQSGRGYGKQGDGGFAYLGTQERLGAIFEVIEIPRERVPPEEIYPASQ